MRLSLRPTSLTGATTWFEACALRSLTAVRRLCTTSSAGDSAFDRTPPASRSHIRAQAAGLSARAGGAERPDVPDAAWITVEVHNGRDGSPDAEEQRRWLDQATGALAALGYEIRSYGVVTGGPAEMKIVRLRRTGQEVTRGWFGQDPGGLHHVADALGCRLQDLELVEPDDVCRMPEG